MSVDLKLVRDARAWCLVDDKAATPGPQTESPQGLSSYLWHHCVNRRMAVLKLVRPRNLPAGFLVGFIHVLNI